jgi:carbamoyl-phosphate synthase large subunit
MDSVNVLITGAGAPGIKGTLYSLLKNWDGRPVRAIGVDMKPDVIGRHLCHRFYQVPPGSSEGFLPALLDICEKERVDVVLPQVTSELFTLARHKGDFKKLGATVALSDYDAIRLANNKHELLNVARQMGDQHPEYHLVRTWDELERAASGLGFPFVIKPPVSSGMRGFRVVYEKIDRTRAFFEEKPDGSTITVGELRGIFGDRFPELLAMEYLPGPEYSVDILSSDDRVLSVIPRKRNQIRSGITFMGTVEKRDDIIASAEQLTRRIGLTFAHGLQYKENAEGSPMLIESNPRVQGTMVLSTIAGANIIYGAVKLALGEQVPDFWVRWDAVLMRYWGGIGIGETTVEL